MDLQKIKFGQVFLVYQLFMGSSSVESIQTKIAREKQRLALYQQHLELHRKTKNKSGISQVQCAIASVKQNIEGLKADLAKAKAKAKKK